MTFTLTGESLPICQIWILLSFEHEAKVLWFCQQQCQTMSVWNLNCCLMFELFASQTIVDLSKLAVTTNSLFSLHRIAMITQVCFFNSPIKSPSPDQIRAMLSQEPVANRRPELNKKYFITHKSHLIVNCKFLLRICYLMTRTFVEIPDSLDFLFD